MNDESTLSAAIQELAEGIPELPNTMENRRWLDDRLTRFGFNPRGCRGEGEVARGRRDADGMIDERKLAELRTRWEAAHEVGELGSQESDELYRWLGLHAREIIDTLAVMRRLYFAGKAYYDFPSSHRRMAFKAALAALDDGKEAP